VAAILETRGLSRRFGRIRAVQDLSLQVEEGDIYGFLGLNGAGKTTTIRMLLRLIRPSAGDVRIFGKDVRSDFISIMKHVGSLVELPAYYPYLSAYRNLEILRLATGGVPSRRIEESLELVGLSSRMHDAVETYSQGMRQRLGIAMALLSRPQLVILDEPTNGLDPQGINHIRTTLQHLNRDEGVTFVVSSHLLHEIEITCNRVGIIKEGKLVVQDTVQHLLAQTTPRVRIECEPQETALGILRNLGLVVTQREDGCLHVEVERNRYPELHAGLAAGGVRMWAFTPERLTLEEFFLSR